MFIKDLFESEVDETIRKGKGGYTLYSHKGKSLGTYPTRAGAEKREKQVNYFKHKDEDADTRVWNIHNKYKPLHTFTASSEEEAEQIANDWVLNNLNLFGKNGWYHLSRSKNLEEGPKWEKFKNVATAGIAAGALGYGAMTGQFTGKTNHQQPAKAPLEINIPGGDIQPQKTEKPTEKLTPSTATKANAEMEKLVLTIAFKAGLRGKELAQFMAQSAHETHGFNKMSEVGSKEYFKKYDPTVNPKKAAILGNTEPGDGVRYRGRGFIQLTGRDNYKRAGQALGLPLEQKPQLATHPEVAAKIAVWFWKTRVRGQVQDFTDTIGVTSRINPNMNGLGDRDMNFQHYMQRLGLNENFADGKKPGRKGLAKRSGVNCKQSVTKLRQVAANSTGEKQRMAHWCANMKSGKKK